LGSSDQTLLTRTVAGDRLAPARAGPRHTTTGQTGTDTTSAGLRRVAAGWALFGVTAPGAAATAANVGLEAGRPRPTSTRAIHTTVLEVKTGPNRSSWLTIRDDPGR